MKLFRYRTFERGFDEIKKSYLWFSDVENLNDPFDCKPVLVDNKSISDTWLTLLKIDKDRFEVDPLLALRQAIATYPNNNASIEAVNAMAREEIAEVFSEMGLCCFSEIFDSTLMWAHYAGNKFGQSGGGVCIEYEVETNQFLMKCKKIQYVSNRVTLTSAQVFDHEVTKAAVMTKSFEWAYEKEWRATAGPIGKGMDRKLFIHPETITAIYFGPKTTDEDIRRVENLKIEQNRKFQMHYCVPSSDIYKLHFHKKD